jgi:hypothetical protein
MRARSLGGVQETGILSGVTSASVMLVNCVVYKEGRKLADIGKGEISDYLKQPGVFVWVAMKDPSD